MKALLVGDVSPTVLSAPLFAEKDINALFGKEIRNLFNKSDLSFINLEVALTESEGAIKKFGPCLKASGNTADVLKELNVTVCGLSNNHIFDFGKKGVEDTLSHLGRVGIAHTGYGKNYEDSRKNFVFEKDGEKICLIAVCEHEYSYALCDEEGARPFDCYDTIEDIRLAAAQSNRVIVLYHGGKEHCRYPSPRLVKTCRAMVNAGADLVLCQHTHIIGCYEKFGDGNILYGQGNFHFAGHSEKDPESWNQSVSVVYDTETNEIEFIPMTAEGAKIEVATGDEKTRILADLEERSATIESGEWLNRWSSAVKEDFGWYVDIIGYKNSNEETSHLLAHYIDCEAHQDILRELFKTAHVKKENFL